MKFHLGLAAALLALTGINSPLVAQFVVSPPLIDPSIPRYHGQWAGPYELDVDEGGLYAPKLTQEIAHALVLPPETVNGSLADDDRVLLCCVVGGGCYPADFSDPNKQCKPNTDGQKYGRTYCWHPGRANFVEPVAPPASLPQSPQTSASSQDFFCGGHTFLPNGDVLWIGGTNKVEQCDYLCVPNPPPSGPPFVGHTFAYRLNTRVDPPTWSAAGNTAYARWYAGATELNDGRILVTGHIGGAPLSGGGPPASDYDLYRESYDPVTSLWSATEFNAKFKSDCSTGDDVHIEDYPRLHLLKSGQIVQTNSSDRQFPDKTDSLNNAPTRFLDVLNLPCGSGSTQRWHDGQQPAHLHLDAPSVHLITWDGLKGEQGVFTEVVYLIGGSTKGIEASCATCLQPPGVFLTSVEKMTNPTPLTTWDSVSDLNFPRTNCNAVILLDGSILVIGGLATVASGSTTHCISRTVPELYKPTEVFGLTAGGGPWKNLTQQSVPRRYHSTAGLLRDGRVFSAGGHNPVGYQVPVAYDPCYPPPLVGCPAEECPANNPFLDLNPDQSDHSVEIFSPPYLFSPMPRPVIDKSTLRNPVSDPYQYTGLKSTIAMDVTMSADLDRVAILKNAADTHGFDFDQRYVGLKIVSDDLVAGSSTKHHIVVNVPQDGYWAPPGYYFLTVVDTLQRPSLAEWVRISL